MRFQFSIRAILVATAAVGTGVASIRAEQSYQSMFARNGLTVVFATVAAIAAIKTSGKVRTFWVGTAIFLVSALVIASEVSYSLSLAVARGMPGHYSDNDFLWWFWCAAPANGFVALAFHWLIWPRDTTGDSPSENRISN